MDKKFYQVVDDEFDVRYKRSGDKSFQTLEEALKAADQYARETESDIYITVAIKRVGPSKAPLEIVDL